MLRRRTDRTFGSGVLGATVFDEFLIFLDVLRPSSRKPESEALGALCFWLDDSELFSAGACLGLVMENRGFSLCSNVERRAGGDICMSPGDDIVAVEAVVSVSTV